jgi:hypothetical protein
MVQDHTGLIKPFKHQPQRVEFARSDVDAKWNIQFCRTPPNRIAARISDGPASCDLGTIAVLGQAETYEFPLFDPIVNLLERVGRTLLDQAHPHEAAGMLRNGVGNIAIVAAIRTLGLYDYSLRDASRIMDPNQSFGADRAVTHPISATTAERSKRILNGIVSDNVRVSIDDPQL